jgi:hypothetical protein
VSFLPISISAVHIRLLQCHDDESAKMDKAAKEMPDKSLSLTENGSPGQEMRSRVICRRCGRPLTDWLEPVDSGFVVTWPDSENIIPKGRYWIGDDDLHTLEGRVVIHLDDRRGMRNHPDPLRFHGCCGASDGRVNLLCACGAEVATEVSDCWTSYFAHFEPEATLLQTSTQVAYRDSAQADASN